jgi:anti-sigma regulatory factor (Ser/Thr protein kinase)
MEPFLQMIPPDVARLASLRRALSDWLERSGVADPPRADLVLATHEAAANAIEHGNPEQPFEVRGEINDRVLKVEISDTGRWEASRTGNDERGRGLVLIKALVSKLEIRTGRYGTTLRLLQQL